VQTASSMTARIAVARSADTGVGRSDAVEPASNERDAPAEALPVKHLRQALDDLFVPNPVIYWLDFLGSAICFYGGFAIAAIVPLRTPLGLLAVAVSVLGLYRAVIFIHELAHFPPGRMPGFRIVWNLVCGCPLLAPDFLYGSHIDHHRRNAYGTSSDGEYSPWGSPGHRAAILFFLVSSFLGPPVAVLRFGLLSPLSWVSPKLRDWVATNASSLVVDMRYQRAPPSRAESRMWRLQEAGAFAYLCAAATGLATNLIAVELLAQLYLTLSAALFLNALRTLAAHRYRSAGGPLTATGQFLDSLNYPRSSWIGPLWAPVGLRFHALHHLFPGIPYHNLAAAHARISRLLPPDSPYHRSEGRGLVASLRGLWRDAGAERGLGLRDVS
jgi:fatty acid desaturase